ncbi:Dystrophin, isoform D [Eufriesea mexicana]|uniref:Dystrophin, isoform D n=1 Tax=Eufriesea mexicana TaxID=516756 RepID=A0A310STA5_9HYME|nr:Dystrophin, isoform D [Eufriesea mexicana]
MCSKYYQKPQRQAIKRVSPVGVILRPWLDIGTANMPLFSPTAKLNLRFERKDSRYRFNRDDLQSEIETHRDVYASLNGTGRKLLSSLASQDDAVMLQRRLDEMNQRWHHLKAKSMAIRNRLESNTEHWNALLLSLRELIEWVIRKDTELTGLGPVCGDVAALQKQEDDHRGFRRQLEDKRPIVENNLLSGRQYIANEPPLSDTSDSEAGRELDGDSRGYRSAEEQARELTRSIRREVNKLSEQWNALIERSDAWKRKLDDTANSNYIVTWTESVAKLAPHSMAMPIPFRPQLALMRAIRTGET